MEEVEAEFAAIFLEASVRELVIAANALGIPTVGCCEGHSRHAQVYVGFGVDYGDDRPEDVSELRQANRRAKAQLGELLGRFYERRTVNPAVRLNVIDGPDAEEMYRLRQRFARERARLLLTDPGRVAANFNYRQYEDTFRIEPGSADLAVRLRAVGTPRLLARRQGEMRDFGHFLRGEAER